MKYNIDTSYPALYSVKAFYVVKYHNELYSKTFPSVGPIYSTLWIFVYIHIMLSFGGVYKYFIFVKDI